MTVFVLWALVLPTLVLGLAGCAGGGKSAVPQAGEARGSVPNLAGRTVMIFPAQRVSGLDGSPDPEITFALRARGGGIEWTSPAELKAVLDRAPAMVVALRGASADQFLVREVRRVGDPLFGYLRRLNALTGAELALIPVQVRYRASGEGGTGVMEIAGALINATSGRVLWFGVVQGSEAVASAPVAMATAAEALAKALVPQR